MPEANPPTLAEVRSQLVSLSEMLRQGDLDPEAQRQVADLIEELTRALGEHPVPSAEVAHLAESAANLARAIRERHDPGLLAAARERLSRAIVAAETEAPMLAGLVRQFTQLLSNLGI